ncbi:transposase family protein [Gemmata sp. SH-PL17]|uniref:helix-turn-helix domain-containing protein n=1 Tax=Gemmata sp. SH-PL17 TaxID=1630693 RepID=UPI0028F3E834|nr:transposase family protein [Gemmata sp. SH-PL17]
MRWRRMWSWLLKPRTDTRSNRQRAIGGGDDFDLSTADHVLLTVIWLCQYPTNEVLGFRFGVSDSTASRARPRCRPAPGARAGTRCACPTPASPNASDCRRCSRTHPLWPR